MAILHKTYGDILKEKLESVVDYNRIIWMEELWVYYTVLKKNAQNRTKILFYKFNWRGKVNIYLLLPL